MEPESDGKSGAFPPHPVAELLDEELPARGWNIARLASEMGGATQEEYGIDYLSVEILLACRATPEIRLGEEGSRKLARALGVSQQFLLNLELAWISATC